MLNKVLLVFCLVAGQSTLAMSQGLVQKTEQNDEVSTQDKCLERALEAATEFQNRIVKEIVVSESSLVEVTVGFDEIRYDIESLSASVKGASAKIRQSLVTVDSQCNVISVSHLR